MKNIKLTLIAATTILFASAFTVIQSINWKIKEDYSVKFTGKKVNGIFKGLKADINFNENDLNEIEMGCSIFQTLIVSFVLEILFKSSLDKKKYVIATNEPGLHLGYRNNISNDIAIFVRDTIPNKRSTQYAKTPPKIAIEIDVKADYDIDFDSFEDYIHQKTQKLLDFGVEKVIWILSAEPQQVIVATQIDTHVYEWSANIEILDGVSFCMNDMDLD